MAQCPVILSGWLSVFVFLTVSVSRYPAVNGKKIFCYYSSFAYTRQGQGNFQPEDINPHLCSHVIYAFVDISPGGKGLVPFNADDQGPKGLYARTLALKAKNPGLKVLLAVGGWLIGSEPFLPVVRSEGSRAAWIQNVVKYLRRHGFDGFDMDWEFPATRGSPPQDKYRYTQLMKGLYEAFAKESADTGREKLLLTMATASGTYYISQSYEPRQIIKYLDYMLLMTYNYHGQWEKLTGHHSGLYPHRNDPKYGEKSQLYQEWSIDFWLDQGIPKEKLIVGIPTYAMTFTLSDQSQHDVRAPAISGGDPGEFTKETGVLAYYEVCDRIKNGGWNTEWIEEQGVPFAYGGNQWAGYENKRSITLKAKNILKRDLGGAFVWSVEMGDFGGHCGQGPYPLLQAINDVITHDSPSQSASIIHQLPSKPDAELKVEPSQTQEKGESPKEGNLHTIKPNNRPRVSNKRKGKMRRNHMKVFPAQDKTIPTESQKSTTVVSRHNTRTTPKASLVGHENGKSGDRISRKIRRRPSTASRRRRVTDAPSSSDRSEPKPGQIRHFHSAASISRKLARKEALDEAADAKRDEMTTTWWFRPSPRPPTTGWTKEFRNGRRRTTSRHKMRGKKKAASMPTTQTQMSSSMSTAGPQEKHMKREHASASASGSAVASAAAAGGDDGNSGNMICPPNGVGLFPHPHSCELYVICQTGSWSDQPNYVMSCPAGTKFDPRLRICNFVGSVLC